MSTATAELTPPAGAQYGWITGRQLSADLDALDTDLLPAFESSTGWVVFSPAAVTIPGPDSIAVRAFRFQIIGGDLINPRTGSKGPHSLPAGLWNVTFSLLNGDRMPMLQGVPIGPEYTQAAPLALGAMAALATGPGTRPGGGSGNGITVTRTTNGVLSISTTTRTAAGALNLGS